MNHDPLVPNRSIRTAPRPVPANDITRERRATRPVRRATRKRPHPAARARRVAAASSLGMTGALVAGFYVVNADSGNATTNTASPTQLVIDPSAIATTSTTTSTTSSTSTTTSTTLAPVTVAPTTIASATPTTVTTSTAAPTTVAPTTAPPTTAAPATTATAATTATTAVAAQPAAPQGRPQQSSHGS